MKKILDSPENPLHQTALEQQKLLQLQQLFEEAGIIWGTMGFSFQFGVNKAF